MIIEHLQRFAAFGCLGLLVEVLFTGLHSLHIGNRAATSKTYLWMFFVWGAGGMVLEGFRGFLETPFEHWWNPFLRAFYYCLFIYFMEFCWGWIFEKVLGRCPWKYTDPQSHEKIHRFSVLGFVRLDYLPYWYILAVLFDFIAPKLRLFINAISRL